MRVVFALLVVAAGCGDAPFPAGHACQNSTECAAGLLCDYGPTPHVCAGMSLLSSDFAADNTDGPMNVADQGVDQAVGDLRSSLDMAVPPDLTPTDL